MLVCCGLLPSGPRTVRRDGVRFQGLRYQHPTMAGHVGDAVTIGYDPRDLSEIRVFYRVVWDSQLAKLG